MRIVPPVWLASRSPRRKQMLERAGWPVRVVPPDLDDAALDRGAAPAQAWVMALAYLKARRVRELLLAIATNKENLEGTILGADTVCVAPSGEVLGQPRDVSDARQMLKQLRNADHHTITGVCLLFPPSPSGRGEYKRLMFCDRADVRIGPVTDQQIEQYVAGGDWRGKAGAYNLSERIEAGWPIECIGDPDTVMGLPMRLLRGMFQ